MLTIRPTKFIPGDGAGGCQWTYGESAGEASAAALPRTQKVGHPHGGTVGAYFSGENERQAFGGATGDLGGG